MTAIRIAAIIGFLAVLLGAFGAHGLETTLKENGKVDAWKTASLYHLVHAVVLLVLAVQLAGSGGAGTSLPYWLFTIGITLFSGSLYVIALTNTGKWLGPVTPIGGLFLLAGWLMLAIKGLR